MTRVNSIQIDSARTAISARCVQRQQGDFGDAVPAERLSARNAAGDMEDRGRGVEHAVIVFHPGCAGQKDRSKKWNDDLAPVRVAAEHKIDVVGSGPIELIRTV